MIRKLLTKLKGDKPARTPAEILQSVRSYAVSNPFNLGIGLITAAWFQTVLFGLGGTEYTDWNTGNDCISAFMSFIVLATGFMRLTHSGGWRYLLSAIVILLGVLSPLYLMTDGALVSSQNLDTLMATDVGESLSLLSTIPAIEWALCLLPAAALALSVRKTNVMMNPDATERKMMKTWKCFALLMLLMIPTVTPLNDIGRGLFLLTKLKYTTPESSWHMTGCLLNAKKVDNYIIFMSESLSEKALGVYGAPFDTTPFLSSVPSKRLSKMVAASMATSPAVSVFTSMNNPSDLMNPKYENNIIRLAREAGLETHWISSQGKNSAYEGRISFIANQADRQYFVTKHDDFAVIPAVKEIVKEAPNGRSRLIFVHTYGAHEEVCDRTDGVGLPFKGGKEKFFDCYLAAALKADRVAEGVVKAVKESGQSYSMIFTSDHAINWYRKDDGELRTFRNAKYKGTFEVPFMMLGSDIREHTLYERERSSLRFIDYFPTWIGIMTDLTPVGYDIFNAPSDRDIEVIKTDGTLQKYSELKDTAPIAEMLK